MTEVELLAALELIWNWRPYLWGRHFKLVVDHAALRWMHTMKETVEGGPASRLMRWALKLAEYRFDIVHKPGAAHRDADGVSCLCGHVSTGAPTADGGSFLEWATPAVKLRSRGYSGSVSPSTHDFAESRGAQYVATVTTARSRQAEQRKERLDSVNRSSIVASYLAVGSPSYDTLASEQHADVDTRELIEFLISGLAADA